jgi:hypothetical protein
VYVNLLSYSLPKCKKNLWMLGKATLSVAISLKEDEIWVLVSFNHRFGYLTYYLESE